MRYTAPFIFSFLMACGATDKDTSSTTSEETEETEDTNTDPNAQECGTVHTVTTTDDTSDMEVYMDFSPENITIAVGDCINFVMSNSHNAIEISQDSYESRDGTPLTGGFQVDFAETKEVYFGAAGVHYYVCQPHVNMDMFGTVTVE